MIEFPKDGNTIGELYGPAMEIDNEADAQFYLGELVKRQMEVWNMSEDEARTSVLANLGYYAGYYNAATFDRVMKVFKTAHPIFGAQYPVIK